LRLRQTVIECRTNKRISALPIRCSIRWQSATR
jgi:hypothetical protein